MVEADAAAAFSASLEADASFASEITSFRGLCGFLSNMHSAPCDFEGERYATVEHAFQAAKTTPEERAEFRAAGLDAKASKRLGRKKPLANGVAVWEANKRDVKRPSIR